MIVTFVTVIRLPAATGLFVPQESFKRRNPRRQTQDRLSGPALSSQVQDNCKVAARRGTEEIAAKTH